MSLRAFLASIVGVLLLGAATVYGALALEGRLDRQDFDGIAVLVATEDIPQCATSDEWADSMELVGMTSDVIPAGALNATSVVSKQVTVKDIAEGDVIKAQLFGPPRDCVEPEE